MSASRRIARLFCSCTAMWWLARAASYSKRYSRAACGTETSSSTAVSQQCHKRQKQRGAVGYGRNGGSGQAAPAEVGAAASLLCSSSPLSASATHHLLPHQALNVRLHEVGLQNALELVVVLESEARVAAAAGEEGREERGEG